MKKNHYIYTNIFAWALVFFLAGNYVFGWTTPTLDPPEGDLSAPLDMSSTAQTKTGDLIIDSLLKVGRYSSAPTGATGALYYDTTTNEFKGYKASSWDSLGGAGTPPGVITAYGGASAPSGWLMCTGSAVSRTTYADLFAVLSTTYGAGDGSTTFNVPNLQQRFPLGKAAAGTGSTLGGTGGAIDHTHTGPSHTHTFTGTDGTTGSGGVDHTHTGPSHTHAVDPPNTTSSGPSSYLSFNLTTGTGKSLADSTHTHSVDIASFSSGAAGTGATGGASAYSHTHSFTPAGTNAAGGTGVTGSNNPPYLVVNYIIKY